MEGLIRALEPIAVAVADAFLVIKGGNENKVKDKKVMLVVLTSINVFDTISSTIM